MTTSIMWRTSERLCQLECKSFKDWPGEGAEEVLQPNRYQWQNNGGRQQRRTSGPDSRNDPLAIGSDTILWSWSDDRIPQTLITIGSSDRENTKPNSLLPIESWYKSFTRKYRTEITRSRLNEKHQTDYIYSWRHNGRCGNIIYMCRDMRASWPVQCTHTVLFTIQHGLDMPCLTGMCMWLTSLNIYKLLTQDWTCSSKCFYVVCKF